MELNSELERLQKYNVVEKELNRAKKKHPHFPSDVFQQLAIMQEEAGEVTMAVNHFIWEGGSIKNVKTELIQTAAMCMRMLEALSTCNCNPDKWCGAYQRTDQASQIQNVRLSLRDKFATDAMNALTERLATLARYDNIEIEGIAKEAYNIADAMLKARESNEA